jgi:hypothetical protein
MNSQFDLNLECTVDNQLQGGFLEDILGDDIYSSSEEPGFKDEVAFDDHLEGKTDVEDLIPPPPKDELDGVTH